MTINTRLLITKTLIRSVSYVENDPKDLLSQAECSQAAKGFNSFLVEIGIIIAR